MYRRQDCFQFEKVKWLLTATGKTEYKILEPKWQKKFKRKYVNSGYRNRKKHEVNATEDRKESTRLCKTTYLSQTPEVH